MKLPRFTPFIASSIAVALVLSLGFFGQILLTGKIIDIQPILHQVEQKTMTDIQQAKQRLTPTAQQNYEIIMEQAMQTVDEKSKIWAEKASPAICKALSQATNADLAAKQLLQQLSRNIQGASQSILTTAVKNTLKIPRDDPQAQQKIADAQAIANAGVRPITIYSAYKLLGNAVEQCQKEEMPESTPDTFQDSSRTKRVAQAVQTTPQPALSTQQEDALKIEFENEKWVFQDGKRINPTEVKANKPFSASLTLRNYPQILAAGQKEPVEFIVKINDQIVGRQKIQFQDPKLFPDMKHKLLLYESNKPLTAGTYKFKALIEPNTIRLFPEISATADIIATSDSAQQPTVQQGLPDIVLAFPREDWLEQENKAVKPSELKTGQFSPIPFFGTVLMNNKGTTDANNVAVTTTIDGEQVSSEKYDVVSTRAPMSYTNYGQYNAYTPGFGSGSKRWPPGKHQIKISATTQDQEIDKSNNVLTAEVTIADEKGSTAPVQPQQDLYITRAALAQYDSVTRQDAEFDFGPQGKLVQESYNVQLRLFSPPEASGYTFNVLINDKPAGSNRITVASPTQYYATDLGALSPGKYHLKIILDAGNYVYETNENNNVFETDFWVQERPKDIKLLTATAASFNDANVKQKGKNAIDLFIEYTADGRVPATLPLKILAGGKTEMKTININMPSAPPSGIYWKQNREYFELPVDRNNFPTHIYAEVDYLDDVNKNDNKLLIPVIISKDRKLYTLG